MTTCAALSRLDCDTCGETTLHAENVCVHCGTPHAFAPVRDMLTRDVMEYGSKLRGVAKTAAARRKLDWNPPKPKVMRGGRSKGRDVADRARAKVGRQVNGGGHD